MKKIKGKPANITKWITGKITTKNNIFDRNRIVVCEKLPLIRFGAKCFLVNETPDCKTAAVQINAPSPFQEGDIISINPNGDCTVVWEKNSCHNAFYVTDLCNSKCIMCPQTDGKQSRYDECLKILDCIDLKNDKNIGITGGEPTLEPEKLLKLLYKIARKSPNQKVHILTNGRNFEDINLVKNLSNIKHIDISYGIPLYSDLAEEHDFITGSKGSFQQTIKGLYNLAQYKQKIEIRIVILKQNYRKLKDIAEYIYRNLPFVTHIALMGMEYHGRAETNYEDINIDPYDYREELYEAVRQFVRYNITADVYNIPLCLADSRIEEFCRDSISSWKKAFLDKCSNCRKRALCSGIFETSFTQSRHIHPFL